jgi:quercetin dioxygenase-like cupin family protein
MAKQLKTEPGVIIELVQDTAHMHLQRSILAPGSKIPEHAHHVASSYVVIAGHGRLTGAQGRDVGPGDAVVVDANAKHGWENRGSDAFHFVGAFAGAA